MSNNTVSDDEKNFVTLNTTEVNLIVSKNKELSKKKKTNKKTKKDRKVFSDKNKETRKVDEYEANDFKKIIDRIKIVTDDDDDDDEIKKLKSNKKYTETMQKMEKLEVIKRSSFTNRAKLWKLAFKQAEELNRDLKELDKKLIFPTLDGNLVSADYFNDTGEENKVYPMELHRKIKYKIEELDEFCNSKYYYDIFELFLKNYIKKIFQVEVDVEEVVLDAEAPAPTPAPAREEAQETKALATKEAQSETKEAEINCKTNQDKIFISS